MAYPRSRSCNDELDAGATDGRYKKVIADRGGDVEHCFLGNRTSLTGAHYGIHEAETMEVPGKDVSCVNPYRVVTPEPKPDYF